MSTLLKPSKKDRVEGKVKEAKGAIQGTAGATSGDRGREVKGKVEKNVEREAADGRGERSL